MDFTQLIQERESIRDYDPSHKVPQKTLERILNAGRLAPSATNRQPWKFIVVSSESVLAKVRACYAKDWFRSAPHILIVKGNRSAAWTRSYDGYNALETDLTIAMDHLILAAENEGVASCWIAAFDPAVLRKALDLHQDEEVFAITPLGYPNPGFRKKHNKIRKPLSDVTEFI